MSDIKNENDNLKDFPNYNKNKFDQVFPGIRERDEKIASLITTIESQKEEIKRLRADLGDLGSGWYGEKAGRRAKLSLSQEGDK